MLKGRLPTAITLCSIVIFTAGYSFPAYAQNHAITGADRFAAPVAQLNTQGGSSIQEKNRTGDIASAHVGPTSSASTATQAGESQTANRSPELLALGLINALTAELEQTTGTTLLSNYQSGTKHLIGFSVSIPPIPDDALIGAGLTLQLIVDLDDLYQITAEGQSGWVSYWLTFKTSFGIAVPDDPLDFLPVGISLIPHEREPQLDDPPLRINVSALSGSVGGLEISAGNVGFGGTELVSVSSQPSSSLLGGEFLTTSGSLLKGEVRRELFIETIGGALDSEEGGISWTQFVTTTIGGLIRIGSLPYGFSLNDRLGHRPLTASDAPVSPGDGLPFAESIIGVRAGLDGDGDNFADNFIPPSGFGSTPDTLENGWVSFYSEELEQKDYRIRVENVPFGWSVIARGANEQQLGDYYDVFSAVPNSNYSTQWYVGCTADAQTRANIDFKLYHRRTFLPDPLLDHVRAAFSCSEPPTQVTEEYFVTVEKIGGSAQGAITSNIAGLDCPIGCVQKTARVAAGANVILTANSGTGAQFDGWSGDCAGLSGCSVSVQEEKTIGASFNPDTVSGSSPSSPDSLVATPINSSQIQLTWDDQASNESSIFVERRNLPAGGWFRIKRLAPNTESFLNTDLVAGTTYDYRVQTENDIGVSAYSGVSSATTVLVGPEPPTELRGWAVRDTKVALSWRDTNNGQAAYYVERSSDGTNWSLAGTTSTGETSETVFVESLSTNLFRVRARRALIGFSAYTAPISIEACAPPREPPLDSPYSGEDDVATNMLLEWRGDDAVGSYDLYFGTQSPPSLFQQGIVPASPGDDVAIDPGPLSEGQTYYWQVVAKAACNSNKTNSTPIRFFSTVGAPNPPSLLSPANGSTGIPTGFVLDWSNVTSDGTVLYDLYLGTSTPPSFFEAMNTRTEKLVEGLTENTDYYWRVVAKSAENPTLTSSSSTWSFRTGESTSQTVTVPVQQDAGLRGGSFGNTNYGGDPNGEAEQKGFGLGNDDSFYQIAGAAPLRGALQFDTSGIPPGSQILNATITMNFLGGSGSQSAPLDLLFEPYTSSWGESAITWNNRPSIDIANTITGTFPLSGFNPTQNDITAIVQAWVSGDISNHGLQTSIPEWEASSFKAKYFYQREWGPGLGADIQVTYGEPCTSPAAPTTPVPSNGATGTPEAAALSWSTVPETSGYKIYFGETSNPPSVGVAASNSFDVNQLAAGQEYFWRVESIASCDSSLTTSSSTWSFTTASCFAPTAPTLENPGDAATNVSREVSLNWTGSAEVSSYEVYLGLTNPPSQLAGTTSSENLDVIVDPSRTYYWKVVAIASCDTQRRSESVVRSLNSAEAPVADAGPDATVFPGDSVVIGGDPAASAGLPPYTFRWQVNPLGGATLSNPVDAQPSLTIQGVPSVEATLQIIDSRGFQSSPSTAVIGADSSEFVFGSGFE